MGKERIIAKKIGVVFPIIYEESNITKRAKAKKKSAPRAIIAPYAQIMNKKEAQNKSSKPSLYFSPFKSQIFAPVFKIKQDKIIIAENANFT